jgi:hypothetical protein
MCATERDPIDIHHSTFNTQHPMKEHLQDGEELVYVARVSRITLVPLIVLLVLVVLVTIVVHQMTKTDTNSPAILIIGLVVATLIALVLAWRLMILSSNHYLLTDRRVIKQTGILNKNSVDSYLEKVNNIEHRQSFWGRMLGYGDLEIDTASDTGMTKFLMIEKPLAFKNAILGAKERYLGIRTAAPRVVSAADKIRDLKALLDDGLITAEEYEMKRKQLLAEM